MRTGKQTVGLSEVSPHRAVPASVKRRLRGDGSPIRQPGTGRCQLVTGGQMVGVPRCLRTPDALRASGQEGQRGRLVVPVPERAGARAPNGLFPADHEIRRAVAAALDR